EETARLVGADAGTVAAYEGGSARVVGRWDAAGEVAFVPVGTVVSLSDDSTVSRVYRTGQPARIDDYWRLQGQTAEYIRTAGFTSVAAAPVAVSGALWGAIAVGSVGDRLPSETEERFCPISRSSSRSRSRVRRPGTACSSRGSGSSRRVTRSGWWGVTSTTAPSSG